MAVVDTPFYIRNGYGYDRGFTDFMWIRGQRAAERRDVYMTRRSEEDYFAPSTLSAAERWLERHRGEKFFLLVDTWDPHEPWDPPDYYVDLYREGHDGRHSPSPCYWDFEEAGLSTGEVELGHDYYCGEVTMVDRWIGRLLERIESLELMEQTAIIFTSDHGFYFGEHGLFGKGRTKSEHGYLTGRREPGLVGRHLFSEHLFGGNPFRDPDTGRTEISVGRWYRSPLYEEVARIPLLVYLPQTEGRRIDALVSAPDLMPTILELADVEIPETVQAPSLLPLVRDNQDRTHDSVVTSWPLYDPGQPIRVVDDLERDVEEPLSSTITDGEWALIYATESEPVELYNLVSDPKQEKNVFDDNEAVARDLHAKFVRLLEEVNTEEGVIAPRRQLP
jgi:arylsulfatase A-like enzyme